VTSARESSALKIASPLHLLLVLVILNAWAYRGALTLHHAVQPESFDRVGFYLRTIVFEWAMLGVVLLGVRLHGSSPYAVLGERWRSAKDLARDVGIAAVFWLLSTIVLSAVSGHQHGAPPDPVIQALLPNGKLESALWIALSITAGICEEAIYRGYLQRQLIAFTRSAVAGIVLTAIAFGAAHAYKGLAGALGICLGGAMYGVLAYWRKSVRPGMMAHAFTDSFAGVLARLLKIRVG
jgi:membrane protease YdiL (CAAX protease family)